MDVEGRGAAGDRGPRTRSTLVGRTGVRVDGSMNQLGDQMEWGGDMVERDLWIRRQVLKSKIHRAVVSQANLHYVGSVTVDRELMDLADLVPGEKVDVVNINNGERFSTYVIEGPPGSGVIGINGAAARLAAPGDLVIIISYVSIPDALVREYSPRVVFVDSANRAVEAGSDAARVPDGRGLTPGTAGKGQTR